MSIQLTLKELNRAFPALKGVAESLTAGKMKYRFARVLNSANNEMELFASNLAAMAKAHGATIVGGNQFKFDESRPESEAITFNLKVEAWMREEVVELWGDPKYFSFDEVDAAADPKKPINAAQLSELLFLISEPKEAADDAPKAAAATT